jgi:hypothetical protein
MYASTPEGFSNGDPNTIKTIFESGFQWQATGQIKNTSNKPLGFLNINIQLIDSNSKIVGLIPAFTSVMFGSLESGQTTTFNGVLNGDDANANAIAYKLTFEWKG